MRFRNPDLKIRHASIVDRVSAIAIASLMINELCSAAELIYIAGAKPNLTIGLSVEWLSI